MTICIAGKNNIAIAVTKHLINNIGKENLVVLTNKTDDGSNKFQKSFLQFALKEGLNRASLKDLYSVEDLVFISLEYDQIIKPQLFKNARFYNIHFSLLPKYKGVYTAAWPILNGETQAGVSLHEIDAGIDTGKIIDQSEINIQQEDTSKHLYLKFIDEGTRLVIKNIDDILQNNVKLIEQPAIDSTYYGKDSIDYSNLKINLNRTAYQIKNQIRAFCFRDYQLPSVHDYKINKAEILDTNSTYKPGHIVENTESYMILSTIDYNIKLYKDLYEELWDSCKNNNLNQVKKVVPYIADIEEKNSKGWNALIIAVYNNSIEVADFLLRSGANVNAVNYNDTSVLMYAKAAAIKTGVTDILDVVGKHNPDLFHTDCYGKNVLEYAYEEDRAVYNYINSLFKNISADAVYASSPTFH